MRQFFKSLLVNLAARGNAYPTALTEKRLLQSLVRKLAPVSIGKPLIRLGPNGDGGYLVPDDLVGVEACFSPGVSFVSGFEKDCADRGMKVFLADRSVERPAESHESFHFIKKYVGVTTNEDFMTVDDWVKTSLPGSQSDLVLQIDIEGYEYEVFLGMSDILMRRFRIIVAEFHCLELLWSRPFFQVASPAFDKILQTHTCVHIHPNNCHAPVNMGGLSIPPVAEFTFLRNDRVIEGSPVSTFPHPLDFDNTSNPHVRLPECWHRA